MCLFSLRLFSRWRRFSAFLVCNMPAHFLFTSTVASHWRDFLYWQTGQTFHKRYNEHKKTLRIKLCCTYTENTIQKNLKEAYVPYGTLCRLESGRGRLVLVCSSLILSMQSHLFQLTLKLLLFEGYKFLHLLVYSSLAFRGCSSQLFSGYAQISIFNTV